MCQGIPLATKGMIYCPQIETVGECRYVLPFNLSLDRDSFELNLKDLGTLNLNSVLNKNKLNLIQLPGLQINKKLSSFKLSLKKCEE